MTEYLHRDFTYQAFLSATLMLLKISAPLDGGVPYPYSINQGGFVRLGASDVLHYVAAAANCSRARASCSTVFADEVRRDADYGVGARESPRVSGAPLVKYTGKPVFDITAAEFTQRQ